ncbi:MAG: P63C domain-containing protein [Pseudolabrys sp.]
MEGEYSVAQESEKATGRAKGGIARAAALSEERRKAIGQKAAEARWGIKVPSAIYGSPDRPVKVGNAELRCFVLDDDDETRVLTQADFLVALGRHRKANVRDEGGEEQMPAILQGKSIKPFISQERLEKSRPIRFRLPSGSMASGYRAEILPMVCDTYLKARDAGELPHNQLHVAKQAEILIRALAHVGIIALVDEATGYQDVRARNALEKILEQFIAEELRKWVKTFPDEFYKEIFRLRKWPYKPWLVKRPGVIGKWTNDLVYDRLAPGVLEELRQKNPKLPSGNRRHKHFQWLTADVGDPRLREHMAATIALMRASNSWDQFMRAMNRALPRYGHTIEMALED